MAARDAGDPEALVDREACKRYVETYRGALRKRIATESEGHG
jgi:hypothetical protein